MDVLSPAPAAPPVPAASAPVPCPRCRQPLADPFGLGWCQACGYCRSLEEDRARLPLSKPESKAEPAPVLPVVQTGPRPSWIWLIVLVVGTAVVAGACFAASKHYHPNALQRALWTAFQILAGIVVMFAGQCYALIVIAPSDERLNFFDAVVPFRLYGLLFKSLPRASAGLWLGTWGLTLIVSALICVGGLGHLTNYLPRSSDPSQQYR